MKQLIFWGLLPLVLPQAVYVRRTAPRHPGAGGPDHGAVGSGKRLELLAVGDSIIAGVGSRSLSKALVGRTAQRLSEILGRRVYWSSIGRIGLTSREILERLVPRMPAARADVILVSAGVNDVTSLSTLKDWEQDLADLLDALYRHSPGAIIAVAGIPPLGRFPLLPQPLRALFGIRAQAFDTVAGKVVKKIPGAVYAALAINPEPGAFSRDGYHPSEESYRNIGQLIATRVSEALGYPERPSV